MVIPLTASEVQEVLLDHLTKKMSVSKPDTVKP